LTFSDRLLIQNKKLNEIAKERNIDIDLGESLIGANYELLGVIIHKGSSYGGHYHS